MPLVVTCDACGAELIELRSNCFGQVSHCGETIRYRVKDGKLITRIHSAEAYSPGNIMACASMRHEAKLRALKALRNHLRHMREDAKRLYDNNIYMCDKYIKQVSKGLLHAAVADASAAPKKAFDVKVNWKNKRGVYELWKGTLLMYARANSDKPINEIESALAEPSTAKALAIELGVGLPEFLK